MSSSLTARTHGERAHRRQQTDDGGQPFLQTYVKLFTACFTVEFLLRRSWFHPAILQARAVFSTG
jgi:hypothetical protein